MTYTKSNTNYHIQAYVSGHICVDLKNRTM